MLLGPFTRPKDALLTRCLDCGFEAHYSFEYVQITVNCDEKNPQELWHTAEKGSRKKVWWTCPEGAFVAMAD